MIRPTKAIAVTLAALTIIGCSASLKSAAESAETLNTSTTPATVQATTATTFTELVDPEPLTAEEQAAWNEVTERLNVAWGTADRDDILARREQGFNTTFYICCNPLFPNTFSFSNPFEAELLGWYGLACDYDGMLRWAYNSWPADPERDSRYGNWSSGDTYLIYPHARSSVRFERLIDGIEVAEKVRTLRRLGVDTSAVDAVLQRILAADINDPREPWQQLLTDARTALDSLSRQ